MNRLLVIVVLCIAHAGICIKLINYAHEGDACDRQNTRWHAVTDSENHFLYCHERHGVYVRDQCATVNGRKKVFDEDAQQCIFRHPVTEIPIVIPENGSARIGDTCSADRDCPATGLCNSTGVCVCQIAYVAKNGQCWPKIGIEKGDCTFDEQCDASWPKATCFQHVCKCDENTVPLEMSHGVACTFRDECPLGGKAVILANSENCRKQGGCFLEGTNLSPFYDCIHGEGFKTSICCPSRAKTIMQPAMPGTGSLRLIRYFYNPIKDTCEEVMFRDGRMVNSNIFETRTHCESYNLNGCPRGLSEHKLIKTCLSDDGCGAKYACFKRPKQKTGTCCASPGWICSKSGGVDPVSETTATNVTEFDVGLTPSHMTAVFYPVIRYYFSEEEHKCKAFLYRGEGGNYNNFLTLEHCQVFCSSVICNGEPLRLTETGKIAKCTKTTKCPDNNICIAGVCCVETKLESLKCPAGSEPLTQPSGNGHILCTLSNPCPLPFTCELSITGGQNINSSSTAEHRTGICCKNQFETTTIPVYTTTGTTTTEPPAHDICPYGEERLLLLDRVSLEPIRCGLANVISPHVCQGSPEFICSFANVNATDGLCCTRPQVEEFRCPGGMYPVAEEGKSVTQCSPFLLDSCPSGSLCVFDELYGTYHCCDSNNSGCPVGQAPLQHPVRGISVEECNPHSDKSCPPGFGCHFSQLFSRYQCCGIKGTCPQNSAAYLSALNGKPLKCSTSYACPKGFFCSYSESTTRSKSGTCCSKDPLLSLCDHGEALQLVSGSVKTCVRSCPFGFECVSKRNISVCCPTPDHVCSLPLDDGKWCRNGVRRTHFFFDATTKSCKSFVYHGCGGNSNRFVTAAACDQFCLSAAVCKHGVPYQTRSGSVLSCNQTSPCPSEFNCIETKVGNYCCPLPERICTLPKLEGIRCKTGSVGDRWVFDVSTSTCSKMQYFGCGGNFNRFLTRESCEEYCFSGLCPHGNPLGSRHRLRTCSSRAGCEVGYECTRSRFGDRTQSICCPLPELVCRQPQEIGFPCGITQYRYFFNPEKQVCQRFQYMGCQGTENNFPTKEGCDNFCAEGFDVCPRGSTAYIDPQSNLSMACSPLYHSCSTGYTCTPRTPTRYYCCAEPPKCTDGAFPYIERGEVAPKRCVPGHFGFFDGCPAGYMCQIATDGLNRCCSNPSRLNQYCPVGWRPLVPQGTTRPLTCNDSSQSCLVGFQCMFSETYRERFCCSQAFSLQSEAIMEQPVPDSSAGIEDVHHSNTRLKQVDVQAGTACSDGSSPYVDSFTGRVRICSPYLRFSCPDKYKCDYNPNVARYQCCQTQLQSTLQPVQTACPAGLLPFLEPVSRQPIVCQPGIPGFCPFTSMCQYSPSYWQFICCTSADPNSHPNLPHRSANLFDSSPAEKVGKLEQLSWLQTIYPGEPGCQIDIQCSSAYPKAYCQDWICLCRKGMFIFNRSCVYECPNGYIPSSGRCIMLRYGGIIAP